MLLGKFIYFLEFAVICFVG